MPNTQDNAEFLGRQLLSLASRSSCPLDEVLALIAAGAKIDEKNNSDETALIWAAWKGRTDIALALIAAGAKIDEKDNDGDTALIRAAQNGRTDIALALIAAGAKTDEKNNDGETAEKIAHERGHTALAERIAAACLERATEEFKTGIKKAMPVPPPLRVRPRGLVRQ